MKTLFTKAFTLTLCVFYFFQTNAQWSTDPNVDNNLGAALSVSTSDFTFCSDGHGGSIFTWRTGGTGMYDIRANRIDSLGVLRWGANGVSVNTKTGDQYGANICEDGYGGCYIAYTDANKTNAPLFCQRLDSNGTALWSGTGKRVADYIDENQLGGQANCWLVNDNGNGVFVTFEGGWNGGSSEIRAQRLNTNGSKKWGDGGVQIKNANQNERSPEAISDGKNGIVIIWIELVFGGQNLLVQHLDHDGIVAFTNGVIALDVAHSVSYPSYKIILSGKDFIACWNAAANAGIYAQKLDASGAFLWGSHEATVCDSIGFVGQNAYPDVMSDGKNGAYFTWHDGRKANFYEVFAQRLNKNGIAKWKSQGILLDSNVLYSSAPYLAPDENKGAQVFWSSSEVYPNHCVMQRLNLNGAAQLPFPGIGVSALGHTFFPNGSVLPVSNNHTIIFMKDQAQNCFAKYVPFDGVLPIAFLNFSAANNGKVNLLTWQTTSEINTNYFSVERSNDGANFYEIAKQKSNNSPSINNYSYTDDAYSNADVYYRLKEIDADGKFMYSKIVSLHQNSNASFKIIPNPASANCTVYFDAVAESNSLLKIFDRNGNLKKQILLVSKQTQLLINVSNLMPGTYFCKIESADKTLTQKLNIVK